jgi:hypothetical protein
MIERLHKFDGDKQAFFASSKFAGPALVFLLFFVFLLLAFVFL